MKDCIFTLKDGLAEGERPKIIAEAFQVFECSWDGSLEDAHLDKAGNLEGYEPPYRNFNGITSKFGAHFILKIDKILMKEQYRGAILDGVKRNRFPSLPVDYGYRDSTNFWCSRFKKPFPEKIQAKAGDVQTVKYAASRIDPNVKFTDEACAKLTKIPRIFLKAALTQMVSIAKEEGTSLIDERALELINDKRRKEKNKRSKKATVAVAFLFHSFAKTGDRLKNFSVCEMREALRIMVREALSRRHRHGNQRAAFQHPF